MSIPSILGNRYRILGKLGQGGMGTVYRAFDHQAKRYVALKVLNTSKQDPVLVKRFLREMKIASHLSHPNIVPVWDVQQEGTHLYYVMELIQGQDLESYVSQKGKLREKEALSIVIQAARALLYAHEQGIIHRDLKPANLLLTPEGKIFLTDFGLSRNLKERSHLTREDTFLGTPEFMAPEQMESALQAGPEADIYSLGCILFFLLTARPPFQHRDVLTLIQKVAHEKPPRLRKLNPLVSPAVETIVQKCLAKSPKDRYPHVAALLYDLKAALEGKPILARPPGAWNFFRTWLKQHPLMAGTLISGTIFFAVALGAWIYLIRQQAEMSKKALAREKILHKTLREKYERLEKQKKELEKEAERLKKEKQKLEKEKQEIEKKKKKLENELALKNLLGAAHTASARGNHEYAIDLYYQFIRKYPEGKVYRGGLIFNNLAGEYLKLAELRRSRIYLQKAYQYALESRKYNVFPEQIILFANLSINFRIAPVTSELLEQLTTLAFGKKWKQNYLNRIQAAYFLYKWHKIQGNLPQALRWIQYALKLYSLHPVNGRILNLPIFWLEQGDLLWRLGDPKRAEQSYLQGLKELQRLYPYYYKNHKLYFELQKRLQKLHEKR